MRTNYLDKNRDRSLQRRRREATPQSARDEMEESF
jgi:hypothetical protein